MCDADRVRTLQRDLVVSGPGRSRTRRTPIIRRLAILAALAVTLAGGASVAQEAGKRETILRPTGRILPERAEVDLVLIDVLVKDREGNPATDLAKSDFELLIDRLPAPISTFESYCLPAETAGRQEGVAEAVPEESALAEAQPRYVVLFFDVNHLTKQGLERSVDASLDYVRTQKRPNDRVMLLAMKGRPILLEDFTDDAGRLAARLAEFRSDRDMLDMSYLEERLNKLDILSKECAPVPGRCERRITAAVSYAAEEEAKARRSIQALRNLMPALASIRGRKTVVHFSETLRDEPGLEYLVLAGGAPRSEGIDIRPLLQDLHREANAAGVSFYMVWAAGLGEGRGAGGIDASIKIPGVDAGAMEASAAAGEDAALSLGATLAIETGGVALKRTNNLDKVFTAVNDDLNCYYELGYRNEGPGDGARHSIIVNVNRKKYEVRHRTYYEDLPESKKLDMRFESALLAPAFFREIPVTTEAYALAPADKKSPFLFKVEFPLREISLVPQADGFLYGEAQVRVKVWAGSEVVCAWDRQIPVTLEPGEGAGNRKIIYEAGCELAPGDYLASAAAMDAASWTIGAHETSLTVRPRKPGILGDVVLWTSSGEDLLVAADAADVGIHEEGSGHGFVPRAERRFGLREAGILYVIVCPPDSGAGSVEVQRSLFAGDLEVATFPPVSLGAPPQGNAPARPSGSCEGLFAPIPPGKLGGGGYVLEVRVNGIGPEPVVHRAGFALSPPDSGAGGD